jgi:hypothetical protein
MSVESIAIVLHHSKAQGSALAVLIGIANHDGDGGAWPAIATLAKYGRCTERSVQRALAQLVEMGEISREVQAGGPARMRDASRPNRYEVLLRCPPWCDGSAQHRDLRLDVNQPSLWIKGVTPTSPGDAHVTGGVTPTSPGGATPTSPEPSLEPSMNAGGLVGTEVQTARAERCAIHGVMIQGVMCSSCRADQLVEGRATRGAST